MNMPRHATSFLLWGCIAAATVSALVLTGLASRTGGAGRGLSGPAAPGRTQAAAAPVRVVTLENGLRLLVKRNRSHPLVAIRAVCLAGLRAEPPEQRGLSLFTAYMMTRGTRSRPPERMAAALANVGTGWGASSGNNTIFMHAACLPGELPAAMALLADIVRNADFPPGEIAAVRRSLISARGRQGDDWERELTETFLASFYKDHPYGKSPLASVERLRAITRNDLLSFHRRWWAPNNTVVAVFGDVAPGAVARLAQAHFGGWASAPAFRRPAPGRGKPLARSVTVRRATRRRLGAVFIGYRGQTFGDREDRYAMDVLDAMVSGIDLPRGRLHEALRGGARDLAYVVHAYNFVGLEPGYFGIYAACEPRDLDTVKGVILRQMGRLEHERIAEEEIAAARRLCIFADVLDRQTNGEQAMAAALDELYGLGCDYGARYADGIGAVTEADLRRVARQYLRHWLCVLMRPGEASRETPGAGGAPTD